LLNTAPETGGVFTLGQNYPNPCRDATTVPFTLHSPADVRLELFDQTGRRAASLERLHLAPGEHLIPLSLRALGLPVANYAYQLTVVSARGTYHQVKRLTAGRG
jgi:hypothetical protein